jgi:hypothetical protein
MKTLNEALVRVYTSFDSTVDQIAVSATKRSEFRSLLPEEFRSINDDELVRRLLNLRKSSKLSRRQTQGV